ncbi:MAG: hypothetical protein ACP5LM_05340 [Thermoplasmata archaeon]|jgi:ABC-type microcin C transport system permease subunit YejE
MVDEIKIEELQEKDFLINEINKGKAIFVTYIVGILNGFFSGFLEVIGLEILSIIFGLGILFVLIYFVNNKYKPSKSTIAWLILLYILSWLTFWIVSLNPPFF